MYYSIIRLILVLPKVGNERAFPLWLGGVAVQVWRMRNLRVSQYLHSAGPYISIFILLLMLILIAIITIIAITVVIVIIAYIKVG